MARAQTAPFANGTAVVQLGAGSGLAWHEIALSFFAVDGVTPYAGAITGSATMAAIGAFSDVEEAGANPLDLATQRRWAPFMSSVRQIRVTVAGAPADARCIVTITSRASA